MNKILLINALESIKACVEAIKIAIDAIQQELNKDESEQ